MLLYIRPFYFNCTVDSWSWQLKIYNCQLKSQQFQKTTANCRFFNCQLQLPTVYCTVKVKRSIVFCVIFINLKQIKHTLSLSRIAQIPHLHLYFPFDCDWGAHCMRNIFAHWEWHEKWQLSHFFLFSIVFSLHKKQRAIYLILIFSFWTRY